jgi:hypothetical protein
MNIVEEKFSKLIFDKKLSISDNPFLVENFIDIKKYISWDILDEAINNDLVWWEIIDQTGKKIEIPFKNPYWFRGHPQQNKSFLINCVNEGHTFVILRCSILNEKLKSLISSIQNCFHVSADIHIYGSKGNGVSFVPHPDMPANFIIQVEGETKWMVFKNKVSNLLRGEYGQRNKNELEPLIETILKPGDLLYVPSRYYHCAFPNSPRLSISIPCLNPETIGQLDIDSLLTDINIYKI